LCMEVRHISFEKCECVQRKTYSKAIGCVRRILLEDVNAPIAKAALDQQREEQPGRSGSDYVNPHGSYSRESVFRAPTVASEHDASLSRHFRMLLAGIQAEFGLNARLKHSVVTDVEGGFYSVRAFFTGVHRHMMTSELRDLLVFVVSHFSPLTPY